MKKPERTRVLADHTKINKKLLSPFRAALKEKYAPYSWARELVPESIWLALVINDYKLREASIICSELVMLTASTVDERDAPIFIQLSAYLKLTDPQREKIRKTLDPSLRERLSKALSPLTQLVPDHPLSFIAEKTHETYEAGEIIAEILEQLYDRNSRISVLAMALAYFLGVKQGKIHIADHLFEGLISRLSEIENYPHSEDSRIAAGYFRAAAPMLFMSIGENGSVLKSNESWAGTFWQHVSGFGLCEYTDTLKPQSVEGLDEFDGLIINFCNFIKDDLRSRLESWPLDLTETETYEVIGALLTRQATLTLDLATSPSMWTAHSGPIMLRAMADVFINLAWIMKNPSERAHRFVEDGLGAVKLMIAHQEQALKSACDAADVEHMHQMIDVWKQWIDSQRLSVFVEINLGSWSGMNTRRMAEEAGCIDFYNYVYQPFSGAVHSNWFHVSTLNSIVCSNPAHRGHRVPAILPIEPDAYWVFLAAKYLRKTFAHFDQAQGLDNLHYQSYEYILSNTNINDFDSS